MTASPSRPTRRLIVWVILSVLTLVGLALVLSLGDSGTAAFQAGTPDTRSNLSVSPSVGEEPAVPWEAPYGGDGAPSAATKAAPALAKDAVPGPVSVQFAGPNDDSDEDEVYTWYDGDRTMRVRLLPEAAQKPGTETDQDVSSQDRSGDDAEPVFRSESGGELMTLPGGVLLVLDRSWTGSDADGFFSRNDVASDKVTELAFAENAYFVETEPGFPSLRLANALAVQDGVEISSPNWTTESITEQDGSEHDPGDTLETALNLPLNTRIDATLYAHHDLDFYKVELLESTLVLLADLDADNNLETNRVFLRWLDSNGLELAGGPSGWKVRRLDAGVYYIRAGARLGGKPFQSEQRYTVQAVTIPDHGDASDSAAPLRLMPLYDKHWRDLDYAAHGDFHSLDDADFFKVELSADTEVVVEVKTTWVLLTNPAVLTPVSVDVFDADGNLLYPHVPGLWGNRIPVQSRGYRLEAGTYYFRLSPYEYNSELWQRYQPYYLFRIHTDAEYTEFIVDCTGIETAFDDPLLGCQDHLISPEAGGLDINVADVWATNKGEGVNVAVVDRDLEGDHEDLRDNVVQTFSFDYTGEGEPLNPVNYHGTAVAGIIAARDNAQGGRGVAPRAGIYSYNLLEKATLTHIVDAMTRNMRVVAISNNSWGIVSGGRPRQISQTWTTALETGVSQGFGGKGIFYVFAAGNSHQIGSHVNLTEFRNFYAQTPVCVVDSNGERLSYSETGYALWICAPIAKMTTDNRNRYQNDFGGTSSAAPVVSGVAALVRSANTSLTWRDVKLVLAASARKNDPANSGWETGALQYGSEAERYSYNPEYGFGVVDAKAAVDLAGSWTNLPAMKSVSAGSGEMELQVPDPADGPGATQLVSDLTLGSNVGFTEFVEVHIDFDHEGFLDLEIEIRSPTGTVSRLAVPNESFVNNGFRNSGYRARFVPLQGKFRFGSARHLGEDPTGVWTLWVRDGVAGNKGSIKGWSIKVYGHGEGVAGPALSNTPATGRPAIRGTAQVGETLSAELSAIGDWDGLSTVTFSYQWIRSDGNTDTDIQGATDSTYTLRADDEGKSIKVRVTFTDDAGTEETLTSSVTASVEGIPVPVPDVAPVLPDVPSVPDIPGPSAQTAVHNGVVDLEWSDVPRADSYEVQIWNSAWYHLPGSGWTDLPGKGIGIVFYGPGAIVRGLERENLYYFRVRANNALGSSDWSESFLVPATDAAPGSFGDVPEPTNSAATGVPTIRRVAERVSILSASVTGIEDENGLDRVWFHYQWISSDGTTNTNIEGATGTSYTLRPDDWSKSIKVRVTFTDRGGYQETLTSAAFGFGDDFPGICGRTAQVRDAILAELADVDDCLLVSASHLNGIDRLKLNHPAAEDIVALQAGDFQGLFNLYHLDLDHNDLTELPEGVFDNLNSLEILYLYDNSLTELPEGVFDNLHSLEDLYLNRNDLTELPEGVFDNLHSLEELNFGGNDLAELPEGVFDNLHSLEDLSLGGNELTELPEGLFDNLHSLERADFGANLGGPFTFTAQLEWQGDDAVVVTVDRGAPFKTRVTLFAQGGALSTSAVTLDLGSTSSEEVTVTPDSEGTVIIRVVAAVFLPGADAGDLSVRGIEVRPGWPVALPGMGLPVITGSPQVGETLTADTSSITDLNGLSGATFSYQWIRNDGTADADIQDATGSTYELSNADVGKTIKVRVTFSDDDGNEETRTSAPTEPVAAGPVAATGLPIIRGTPIVGQTLTADTSSIADANGLTGATFTYNWSTVQGSRQTWVKLSSSDASYTVRANDVEETIRVVVTFTDDAGYQERLTSAPTEPVVGANSPTNNPATGLPTIDGTAQVGGTLTAVLAAIADADGLDSATFSYQWIRNDGSTDTDIPGAIGDTYELDADDEGKTIKVKVTFIDDARNGEIVVSAATEPVAADPNNSATGAPTINGTPEVGEVLTADTSAIADADGLSSLSFNYQWISSDGIVDTDIQDATDSTYTVDADDEGNVIKVRVIFTDGGGSEETLISAPTEPVQSPGNTPATGTVTISGTPQVRETLTADVSGIADADGLTNVSYRYQWINSDGTTPIYIQSAVAATYTPRYSDGGKIIRVRVTFADDGGNREALTSAATEAVQFPSNTPATGSVTISGTAQVGETLIAVPSIYIHDEEGTGWYRYQWTVNDGTVDTDVPDETGATYIVRNSDGGKTIKVRLAFTDRANNEESFTSEATGAVAPPPPDSFCHRTPQLRDTFVAWVKDNPAAFLFSGLTTNIVDCAQVTEDYLPHVTELVLSDSGIDSLQPWDFRGLTGMRRIDLNGNNLSELPDGVFDELRFLRRLYLNDNNLSEFPDGVFEDLTSLNVLDLSGNNLSELPDGVFRGRNELKELRLEGNPGAPFTFTAELDRWEPWGDYGLGVKVAPGTPFYITVTLLAEGGTLSAETVTVCCGGTVSHAIRVTPDGNEPVTVSVVSVAFNFRPNRSASGIQVGLGDPLIVPVGQDENTQATGLPAISGTSQVGRTLTADTPGITDADGLTNVSYTYQWIASNRTSASYIQSATASTYELSDDDVGKTIRVRVSFTDDAENQELLTSEATEAVVAAGASLPNTPPTGLPTISGTAQVDETLTADVSSIADEDGLTNVSYSYQWIRSDGTNDADIGGQTGSTYTLTDDDVGKIIKVRVSFTDDADHEETLTSAATGVVAAKPNTPATGAPTIDGTAQVGETLTVLTNGITDADGLTNPTYSYQWLAANVEIAGATNSTYTLSDEDEGKAINVKVSFTDDAGHEETLTSAATGVVAAKPNTPATGAPTIDGTAQVDETLTALTNGITDADGLTNVSYSYQWIRSDNGTDADIAGQTASTYTLVFADQGKTIKVRVSFTDDANNAETLTSAATAAVAARPNTPATGAPTIDGTAQVGETLTALTNGITDADGLTSPTYSYQWIRSDGNTDADIARETASTYTLSDEDVGKSIKVRVSFADDADNEETLTSAATAAASRSDKPVADEATPVWSADMLVREYTSVSIGAASADLFSNVGGSAGLHIKSLWSYTLNRDLRLAFEEGVLGAADLTLQVGDLKLPFPAGSSGQNSFRWTDVDVDWEDGQTISVRIVPTSATVTPQPNTPATGAPTITGAAQVDETLTADVSSIADSDGLTNVSYSYQWVRNDGTNDADIAGETASTYTPVSADEGKAIKVKVSFTDDAGNEETLTSAATGVVAAKPNTPATGAPTIDGTAQVDETLTALTNGITDADGLTNVSYSYQWIRSDNGTDADIAGQTASTYRLVSADVGKTIKVRVSFTDDANNNETLTSAATAAVAARPNSPATGLPTIIGTAQVDETLSADTSPIDDEDGLTNVAYSYQWVGSKSVFDDDTGTSYILTFEIPGQAGSTYTLAPADEGWTFEVKVSFTDDAGNAESLTSAATGEVEAKPNTRATGLPNISGTPQVGETLTADTSAISDEDGLSNVSYKYQWLAGGSEIDDATSSSYLLTASEQGQTIQVKVTFTDDADNQESLTSAETLAVAAKPNTAATGEPTISGTPQVDETLTADTSAISDEDGLDNVSYQYQWLRDDADIAGQTNSTYELVSADEGKTIKVRVTFNDDAGNAESLTSTATTAVAAQPAETPAVLLTASFANVPADHNGSNFTFQLTFSENVDAGYARIRDHALTVTGGSIASASRTTQGSNQGWNVEVDPTGNEAVTITLPETTDCNAARAICTDDERMLSHTRSVRVAGPPAISVSDATVQEAEGAVLVFTATLSHASSRTVTVDYATSDGTAQAGSDYTAKTGTLTFNTGDTSQTVQVTVLTDSDDEGQETITLTLSNPSQATLDDAAGTGAIENGESSSGTQEDPPAETPAVLLTASFGNMPADHNGENFTFQLSFSENVEAGYARIRDQALTVTGGSIASASRTTQGSNQSWNVEVDPTGNEAITITLPETTDCDASGAICTDDGRKLSHPTSETVAGPPAISVSGAAVQEAEGAVLVFSVTLNHASSRTVTVDYATSDGTAQAGPDYTAASGTLTFNAGDTSQTVQVTVLTDSEDESDETLTLTLSNPSQATLDDATGTGTIKNGEPSSGTQEDPPAETPVVLLTANFSNMPATHNGSAFTFDLSFSENVRAGYERIRDDAFAITGGDILKAQRKAQGSNQNWTITVKPDGNGAVYITLPETTDCNATGAICTYDERELSHTNVAAITGPG